MSIDQGVLNRLMQDAVNRAMRGAPVLGRGDVKGSIGEQVTKHAAFERYRKNRLHESDLIEVSTPWVPAPGEVWPSVVQKANEIASSQFGIAPQSSSRLPLPETPLRVRDLFPQLGLTSPAFLYSRVTGFSNNAAQVPELSPKPQSWLTSEPVTATDETTATYAIVSRQSLDDVAGLRAFLDATLQNYVLDSEDAKLLTDLLATPIQEQPKGSDTVLDAIRKAVTKLATAWGTSGYRPNAAVFNSADWEALELTKYTEDTGGTPKVSNQYLLLPAGGAPQGVTPTVWRMPVVVTPALAQGTAIIGDFTQGLVGLRDPMSVRFSDSHASLFTSNQIAILAETRVLLAVFSPKGFAKITGL